MRFLLDSNTLSDLYEPSSPGGENVLRRMANLRDSDNVVLSVLVFYEMEYGYANAPEDRKRVIRKKISDAQSEFSVLPLTPEGARLFGSLKANIRRVRGLSDRGSKVHNIDLMLAATAITEGCTLVSADSIYTDLRELDPQLKIENWLV